MILRFFGRVADVTAELARTAVALGEFVAESAIERMRDRRSSGAQDGHAETGTPRPAPPQPGPAAVPTPAERVVAAARASAAASAPLERAAAAPPTPVAVPAPEPRPEPLAVVPEPTRGQAARIREAQREGEQTEDSPGPEIRVDEPWPGYAAMNAPEIIDRVRVSDEAVRAVVALYEGSHRKRKTVLRAAGAS